MTIEVRSQAFEAGQPIPLRHTQDGDNLSPPLRFEGLPRQTRELALIVDDPDAPTDQPWVHWLMYKIPGATETIDAGVPVSPTPPRPAGARQGRNTAGNPGFDGPAPPKGHGTHHYHFKVYALDTELDLPPEATKEVLMGAMEGHVIDQGELIGTYER